MLAYPLQDPGLAGLGLVVRAGPFVQFYIAIGTADGQCPKVRHGRLRAFARASHGRERERGEGERCDSGGRVVHKPAAVHGQGRHGRSRSARGKFSFFCNRASMVMDAQWLWAGAAVLLCLYVLHVNRGLSSVPNEAASLSPTRFDAAAVTAAHARLCSNPISIVLPPKTGRRYIVVGGGGFLPGRVDRVARQSLMAGLAGWIVVHLLARGEDPKRIRIIDIRAPTRKDLTTGPAAEVAFHQADVSNAESVLAAFTAQWPEPRGDVPVTVFHSGKWGLQIRKR